MKTNFLNFIIFAIGFNTLAIGEYPYSLIGSFLIGIWYTMTFDINK